MSLEQDLFKDFQSDEDKNLKGGTPGGKFGLNTGAKLVKFEYNANCGKDGAAGNGLDIEVTVGDKRFMQRNFEISKVFGKDGEITDTTSEAYTKGYNQVAGQLKGIITHYLKVFYTEEEIKAAFSKVTIKSFVDYFKFVAEAVKIGMERKGNDIDIFLQYQWNITSGQSRTFLELPKNMKDGAFVCAPIVAKGTWTEVRDKEGLHYEDEAGTKHRFTRDSNYLDSNKAKQQGGADSAPVDMSTSGSTASASTAW